MQPFDTVTRRRPDGSIDTDFYKHRAERLRAAAWGEALQRLTRACRIAWRSGSRLVLPWNQAGRKHPQI